MAKRITRDEYFKMLNKADGLVKKYGWEGRKVTPYSWPVRIDEFMKKMWDYDDCTSGSKNLLRLELAGLLPILEAWEKYELEPKIRVRIKTGPNAGKIREITKDLLDLMEDLVEILDTAP